MFLHLRSSLVYKKNTGRCVPSVELDQILWVNLIAVKDDVDLRIGHVIHTTVVKVGEAGILGWRPAVHRMTHCVFSNEHSGEEHGLIRWLTREYWRRESVSVQRVVVFPCGVTEFAGVFGIPSKVAPFAIDVTVASCQPPVKVKRTYSLYVAVSGAMKQHPLLYVQSSLDFSQLGFFSAEEFPQIQILDPLDGFDWMIHCPFIESGHFFKLICVSDELDKLIGLICIDPLPVTGNRQSKIITNKPEASCRVEGALDWALLPCCYIYLSHH